jgi:hypothetical protein
MSDLAPNPNLLRDEDIDALTSCASMARPPISLTAAPASARQPALRDHPEMFRPTHIGHSNLVLVFDGECVQAGTFGNLAQCRPLASPAGRKIDIQAVYLEI